MDFFGIGPGEILVILLIAVIVLGPGRMVEVGRTLGRFMQTLKKASYDLTAQVNKELEEEKKIKPPPPPDAVSKD